MKAPEKLPLFLIVFLALSFFSLAGAASVAASDDLVAICHFSEHGDHSLPDFVVTGTGAGCVWLGGNILLVARDVCESHVNYDWISPAAPRCYGTDNISSVPDEYLNHPGDADPIGICHFLEHGDPNLVPDFVITGTGASCIELDGNIRMVSRDLCESHVNYDWILPEAPRCYGTNNEDTILDEYLYAGDEYPIGICHFHHHGDPGLVPDFVVTGTGGGCLGLRGNILLVTRELCESHVNYDLISPGDPQCYGSSNMGTIPEENLNEGDKDPVAICHFSSHGDPDICPDFVVTGTGEDCHGLGGNVIIVSRESCEDHVDYELILPEHPRCYGYNNLHTVLDEYLQGGPGE